MSIRKSLKAALSETVGDFMESARPMGGRIADGHYTCNFGGLDVNTADESQLIDGEPSVTVTTVWVTVDPIKGKQIRLQYNLSRKDKNGNAWMLRNLFDDLHNLGVYSDTFKFDREEEATEEKLEELLEALADEQLEGVTLTISSRYDEKRKQTYQDRYIDMPAKAALSDAPAAGSTGTATGDDEPPVKPGDSVKYQGRDLVVVSYDDITEEVVVKKPNGKATSTVALADLEVG